MANLPSPRPDPWARFPRDPRAPELATMRAGDVDRAALADILGEAFADGRLDRAEYDERSEEAVRVKTFGEIMPLVADLVPATGEGVAPVRSRSTADLEARAEKAYRAKRQKEWVEAVTTTLICFAIWGAIAIVGGGPHFPWPLIVAAVTFGGAIETTFARDKEIAKQRDKIERKDRRALERERRRTDTP